MYTSKYKVLPSSFLIQFQNLFIIITSSIFLNECPTSLKFNMYSRIFFLTVASTFLSRSTIYLFTASKLTCNLSIDCLNDDSTLFLYLQYWIYSLFLLFTIRSICIFDILGCFHSNIRLLANQQQS